MARKEFFPLLDDFLKTKDNQHTRTQYRRSLVNFEEFAKKRGISSARDVEVSFVKEYFDYTTSHRRLMASCDISVLRSFFRFLEDQNVVKKNPVHRDFSVKRGEPRVARTVSAETIGALLNAVDLSTLKGARNHAILSTLFYTCSRIDPVMSMRRRDYTGDLIRLQNRQLPVHPELRISLDRYLEMLDLNPRDVLFQSLIGGKSSDTSRFSGVELNRKFIRDLIGHYAESAGIREPLSPDIIRDSAIVIYLKNGGSLQSVLELSGHSSFRFLMRFVDMKAKPTLDDISRISTRPG